jgi:outer membrane receptor for ferrienterochelin and colicin
MTYAAFETNLSSKLNFRLSRSDYFGSITTEDEFDPSYSWNGVISNIHFSNTTAELRYLLNQRNMFALAYTIYQYNIDNKDLPAALIENSDVWGNGYFMLNRQQASASWRHDWDSGLFSIAQISYTSLINGYNGGRYKADSLAAGLRVGFTF